LIYPRLVMCKPVLAYHQSRIYPDYPLDLMLKLKGSQLRHSGCAAQAGGRVKTLKCRNSNLYHSTRRQTIVVDIQQSSSPSRSTSEPRFEFDPTSSSLSLNTTNVYKCSLIQPLPVFGILTGCYSLPFAERFSIIITSAFLANGLACR
jgi:hypothetical protein